MPYTSAQLTSYFTTLSGGAQPDATTAAAINTAASQDATGLITDAQAFGVVASAGQIRATTDVAVATYALFTGATPSQAGINYLVNNPGTGYNTSYYNGATGTATAPSAGGFNTENRYYNAAINLAATPGAVGYSSFVAMYGSLSLSQAISAEYNQIIGTASVGSTAAAAAIASITAAIPFFQAVAATRASAVNQDIATKAMIAAYILEEGVKADVGIYAKALDGFNAAFAMGSGVFNTNILTTFGAGGTNFSPAAQALADGQTFTASGTTVNSIGVAANGVGVVNVGASTTINLTGDIAVNNGQLVVNVANAATNAADVLNLNVAGQTIATPASFIAAGVETINLTAQTSGASVAAGTVLSVDIQDANLTTLTIRGNESVAYSAPLYAFLDGTFSTGALATINASAATAPVTLDVSSATGAAAGMSAGAVTVTGTIGADTFLVRNAATVTGGGGADTIMVYAPTSLASASVVTDDHAGVIVGFAGLRATSFNATTITATSVQNGLDQAAARGPGVVSFFQSGGDTYVVADASTANTFQPGTDYVIRLVGAHNLASSVLNAQGAVVLGG